MVLVYQKYLVTTARVGCLRPSVSELRSVLRESQTNNQRDKDQDLVASEEVWTTAVI